MIDPAATLALADWRRELYELYARIRSHRDPRAAWRLWRKKRDRLFAAHPQTPLAPRAVAGFRGLPYFPYDPALRFAVRLVPAPVKPLRAETIGHDGAIRLRPFGATDGLAKPLGRELTLFWIEGYGGGLFLPFRDATSGAETFGGGRYLLDGLKGADLGTRKGRLILDFNFAYHPSCRYSPAWVCPLAPPENRLSHAVRAGERL